jgi:FkbM family methyltransferase
MKAILRARPSSKVTMQEIEFHRALHRPGVIVDVGAHDGRLTLPLAELPHSRVVAFEPLPSAFARLQQAVASAYGGTIPPHITLRREALADRNGMTTLSAPWIGGVLQEEWAAIFKDYTALRAADPRIEGIQTWSVPLLRLDDVGLTDVSAIKIDVEGAELEVLHGAWMTLQNCRPCLSIEIEERHRQESTRAVPEFLRELDFEGWFEFFGEWRHIEHLDIATMQRASPSPADFSVSHPYVFTFYFVPSERREELGRLARLP